ncbi:cytochrome P450 [Aspergillus californicus]
MLEPSHLALIGVLTVIAFALRRQYTRDPREPPTVGSTIPVLGHIFGLLRHGVGYFAQLTEKHPHPIFAIDLVLTKVYLVKSPAILQAIQRTRALTFDPFVTFTTERLAGVRGAALNALRAKEAGGGGGNNAVLHAMHPTLTGKPLDRMNERMLCLLSPLVDTLAAQSDDSVDLYGWIQHAVTAASTEASYGRLNPYRERSVEEGFWAFESNLSPLIPGILQSIVARKAYQGREAAHKGFVKYYAADGHKDGSELTIARHKTLAAAGLHIKDIARIEVSMGLGLLSNTVPAAFWILFDLYRRPDLLREIREELTANALRIDHTGKHIINVPAIRDDCPLLVSTYQEILRVRAASSPTRIASQDVLLADKYLLRKGCIISIPGQSIARREDVWGSNALDFNPRRYIKTPDHNPRRTGGFMSFGVSPVICPGRHFASTEILGVVALLALRLDIEPTGGAWYEPRVNSLAIASGMKPILGGFEVRVKQREGVEGVSWDCESREGSGVFPLMVG